MTPTYCLTSIIAPALDLLPPAMDTPSARAQLLATALQESGAALTARRQISSYRNGVPVLGPARGLWMFERHGGTAGVLEHRASRALAADVLLAQGMVNPPLRAVHMALEHDDMLAACFARLLLWTDPRALPAGPADSAQGWLIYLGTWRPGKPKPLTWAGHFATAWKAVMA